MPFIERNKDGDVVGIYANKQTGYAEEFVADADRAVVDFQDRARAALDGRIPETRSRSERIERMLAREGLSIDDLKAELAKPTARG